MKVECLVDYESILKKDQVYTVMDITDSGDYILAESNIPFPQAMFRNLHDESDLNLDDLMDS